MMFLYNNFVVFQFRPSDKIVVALYHYSASISFLVGAHIFE